MKQIAAIRIILHDNEDPPRSEITAVIPADVAEKDTLAQALTVCLKVGVLLWIEKVKAGAVIVKPGPRKIGPDVGH